MQQGFLNADVCTFNDSEPKAEAFLLNEENIVFVGNSADVESLFSKQTIKNNLNGKFVLPAMYGLDFNLSKLLRESLKTANSNKNKGNFEQKLKFNLNSCDFEEIKKCWNNFQNKCISSGITTIWAKNIDENEFQVWEQLSEKKLIKIDVIGFVDLRKSKSVMDNNCKSFRKYKNGFRLGGYNIKLDGKISEKKAWLERPYKHSRGFVGFGEIVDEELIFIIKTALEEKKQLVIQANGGAAINQILRCYDAATNNKDVDDNFKFMISCSGPMSKKLLVELAIRNIGLQIDLSDLKENFKQIKKLVGRNRFSQMTNYKRLLESDVKTVFTCGDLNSIEIVNLLANENDADFAKLFSKQKLDRNKILKLNVLNSAYFSFEEEQKGSLESGKKANFVVLDENPLLPNSNKTPSKVFINGKELKLKN